MLKHNETGAYLASQIRKEISLEQLRAIEEKVDRGLDYGMFSMNGAEEDTGNSYKYIDDKDKYIFLKGAYCNYKGAMRYFGDAYDISEFFSIQFTASDKVPYVFVNYLFESKQKAKGGYLRAEKASKKALHKAAKLRLKNKLNKR